MQGLVIKKLCLVSCTPRSPRSFPVLWVPLRSASWCRSVQNGSFPARPRRAGRWDRAWWRPLWRRKGIIFCQRGIIIWILISAERLKHLSSSRAIPLTAYYGWQRNLKMRVVTFHFLLFSFVQPVTNHWFTTKQMWIYSEWPMCFDKQTALLMT